MQYRNKAGGEISCDRCRGIYTPVQKFQDIFPPPFFITTTSVDFNLLFFSPRERIFQRKRSYFVYDVHLASNNRCEKTFDCYENSLSLRFIVNFLSSYVFALYSSISEDETRDIGLLKYDSKTPEMMKSILSYLLVLRRQSNNQTIFMQSISYKKN